MREVWCAARQLGSSQIEHARVIESNVWAPAPHAKQRPGALNPDVEPFIVDCHQQAVDDGLRTARRQRAGQAPSYWRCVRRVEQRVNERSWMPIADTLQRLHRHAGDGPLAEQRNYVRQDRRGDGIPRIEHASNATRIA